MADDVVALFVPIVGMVVVGAVLIAYFYFRHRNRAELQHTVRNAIDKGSDLTPELVSRLAGPQPGPNQDLRRAMVWIAIGLGFLLFGVVLGEGDAVRPMAAISMFPILVGIAYLLMWKFARRGGATDP